MNIKALLRWVFALPISLVSSAIIYASIVWPVYYLIKSYGFNGNGYMQFARLYVSPALDPFCIIVISYFILPSRPLKKWRVLLALSFIWLLLAIPGNGPLIAKEPLFIGIPIVLGAGGMSIALLYLHRRLNSDTKKLAETNVLSV